MSGKFSRDNKQHQDFTDSVEQAKKQTEQKEQKQLAVRIDADLLKRVKTAAAEREMKMQDLVAEALKLYLK